VAVASQDSKEIKRRINMLSKNNKKGKCPFNRLRPCSDKCVLYRRGVRFNETKSENFPFEECAINIIAENLEAMHQRGYMVQKEVGEMKSVATMKILHDLGKCSPDEMNRAIKASLKLPQREEPKLIEQ